jgi:hypothetical protein
MKIARLLGSAALAGLAVMAWPQTAPFTHPNHLVVQIPVDEPPPGVSVELLPDSVDGYNLHLTVRNFRFTPELVNAENVPNQGHAHLYINGEKIGRLYCEWAHLPRALFKDGINLVHIVLNANDHSSWGINGQAIGADVLVDSGISDGDPIVREDVSYTLSWDWTGAQRFDAKGWLVDNDLGYRVQVNSGRLVTRNLELIDCHPAAPGPALNALWRLLSPRAAYAGHSSLVAGASRITKSYEEDLADPGEREIESRTVSDPQYCQAHYLIARAKGAPPSAAGFEVAGSWSRDGQPGQPFSIRSNLAYGEIKQLRNADDGRPAIRSIVGGIRVEVRRPLAALFAGVDFAEMDERAQAMQALRSLVGQTQILVD